MSIVAENNLKTLRKFMFEEMMNLRAGKTTAQEATAMSKLGGKVIDSYKVEIDAVKTANELKDKNISYAKNIKALEE